MRPNPSGLVNIVDVSVRKIIRLDVPSILARLDSGSNQVNASRYPQPLHKRPSRLKLASIATIRALFVTCSELLNHLQVIGKSNQLTHYHACQRPLMERVLPDSLYAFEYCQDVLGLKGATDSPIATKLAKVAHSICDHIDLIKERLNTSLEYYELKNNVFPEIQTFASKKDLTLQQISPLMYCLTETLPLRLEAFGRTASKDFPDSLEHLQRLRLKMLELAQSRKDALEKDQQTLENPRIERAASLRENMSLDKPRIRPFRGLKLRRQFSTNHQAIPLFKDLERQQKSPRKLAEKNKENQFCFPVNVTKSKLQSPTRIYNRKVSGPIKPISQNFVQNHSVSQCSRIPRPTEVSIQRLQSLRRSGSHGRQFSGDSTWCPTVKTPLSAVNLSRDPNDSYSSMMLSSPEVTCIDTPLSRKSSIPILRPRESIGTLNIQRRRNAVTGKY